MNGKGHSRILFISNSQGTAAGLEGKNYRASYPLLVQEALAETLCLCWTISSLSVDVVDSQFCEMVLPNRPDLVVLQCGIIECGLRILPKDLRDLFRIIPGGRILTKAMHDRQGPWRGFLNRKGIRFLDLPLERFLVHLGNIHGKCRSLGIDLLVMKIPLLSERCSRDRLPGNNEVIAEYNRAIERLCEERGAVCLDPFGPWPDATRNSLYLEDTVHFSLEGHRVIAARMVHVLREHPRFRISGEGGEERRRAVDA